jgi:hypothetical protein
MIATVVADDASKTHHQAGELAGLLFASKTSTVVVVADHPERIVEDIIYF